MAPRREAPDEPGRLRAFFAIALEGRPRRVAEDALDALRARPDADRVRWVRPEGLHVTLRFLGQIEEGRVPRLLERVTAHTRDLPPVALRLGALAAFPSTRRARVLTLGAGPEAPLQHLAEAVERGVVEAGFAPEDRPFRPHVTLGRVRRGARLPQTFFEGMTGPDTAGSDASPVSEALLFRSDLTRGGAIYTSIGHVPLDAPGPESP